MSHEGQEGHWRSLERSLNGGFFDKAKREHADDDGADSDDPEAEPSEDVRPARRMTAPAGDGHAGHHFHVEFDGRLLHRVYDD